MEEEAQGGDSLPLSLGGTSAAGGTIAVVIVFFNISIFITILISFMQSLSRTRCNPYLNMMLYATYYDPMMCCHPMMFE